VMTDGICNGGYQTRGGDIDGDDCGGNYDWSWWPRLFVMVVIKLEVVLLTVMIVVVIMIGRGDRRYL